MCNCKSKTKREPYTVKLPGGLRITKGSEAAAKAYAANHPGSTVTKAT